MFRNNLLFAAFFLFLFGSAACNLSGDAARGNENSASAPTGSGSKTSDSNANAADAPRALEAKYYQDADGNAIPDFIEIENGYDPNRDDCAPDARCGNGADGTGDINKKPINTLLMLDSSGSMRATAGGKTKIEAAKSALATHVANAPANVKFGFLVYGHKGDNTAKGKPESCQNTEILEPLGGIGKANVNEVLARFEPTGWTPIGAALEKAREAFAATEGANNHIILVSDGIETCGGDPVAVAKQLHEEGFKVTVDVIGFGVPSNDAAQLRRIAEAGGGTYFDAKTQADIENHFKKLDAVIHKNFDDSDCNYQAGFDANSCDSAMVLKCLTAIGEKMSAEAAQTPGGVSPEKFNAQMELSERIRAAAETRRARNGKLLERGGELGNKAHENLEKSVGDYNKIKP